MIKTILAFLWKRTSERAIELVICLADSMTTIDLRRAGVYLLDLHDKRREKETAGE